MPALSPLSLRVWGKCHVGQDALLLLECMLITQAGESRLTKKERVVGFLFFSRVVEKNPA